MSIDIKELYNNHYKNNRVFKDISSRENEYVLFFFWNGINESKEELMYFCSYDIVGSVGSVKDVLKDFERISRIQEKFIIDKIMWYNQHPGCSIDNPYKDVITITAHYK